MDCQIDSKSEFIQTHMNEARIIARKYRWIAYRSAHIDYQDIESEAIIGLLKAYDRFDGRRGVKFGIYASRRIDAHIKNFIQKQSAVRIPERIYWLKVRIVKEGLKNASSSEIASSFSCSEEKASLALKSILQELSFSLYKPKKGNRGKTDRVIFDSISVMQDHTEIYVREFLSSLDEDEQSLVKRTLSGERTNQPALLLSVRKKLAVYMGIQENEIKKMSSILTKQKYFELHKHGLTDVEIRREYGLCNSQFYRLKAKWSTESS